MTQIQLLRMGLRVAADTLERAMDCTDVDEMEALALQAMNRILDSSKPKPVAVSRQRCANAVCGRLITECDPIFGGYCSTMCREGSRRGVRVVPAGVA